MKQAKLVFISIPVACPPEFALMCFVIMEIFLRNGFLYDIIVHKFVHMPGIREITKQKNGELHASRTRSGLF